MTTYVDIQLFSPTKRPIPVLKHRAFENYVGKGGNAGNQHFSFSHNVFHPIKERNHLLTTLLLPSENAFELVEANILSFIEEFKRKINLMDIFNLE